MHGNKVPGQRRRPVATNYPANSHANNKDDVHVNADVDCATPAIVLMIHFQVVRVPRTDYDNFGYVIGLTILTQQLSMSKEDRESSSRTRKTRIDRSISFDISPKMLEGCS